MSGTDIQSRRLIQKSTWCGVVCGLLAVITALNVLPPVDVSYSARTEVFVSQYRFEHLEELAHRDAQAWLEGQASPIRLMGIRVLDDSQADALSNKLQLSQDAQSGQLLLVELKTRWQNSFSEEQLLSWLDEHSQPNIEQVDASLAIDHSVASWKLKAAEHYIARQDYLAPVADENADTPPRQKFTLAAGSSTPKIGFASLTSSPDPSSVTVGGEVDQAGLGESADVVLQEQLLLAKAELNEIHSHWQQRLAGRAGTLEVAQPTDLDPTSSQIPFWMAASILILGCCAAASAGWVQHRLQAGGVFDPARVASQLSEAGVNVLTAVHLDDRYTTSDDLADKVRRNASVARRFLGSRIVRISEWALWFWVYMIAFRLVLDSMWRSAFLESPLAALGRVLVGMP